MLLTQFKPAVTILAADTSAAQKIDIFILTS